MRGRVTAGVARGDDRDRPPPRPRRDETLGSRVRTEDLNESWPEIPEWVDRRELGRDVLGDLRSLSKQGAEFVADHLVAAGALADEEPEVAWRHARAARSQGGRVAVVRETVGLVAYRAGEWAEAISELRAARRMGGGPGHLPVMADAERALGHPERAIELSRSVEATALDAAAAAELTIVVAGARSDLGQDEVALVGLRAAAEGVDGEAPYAARIYYAYADLLDRTDRRDDAITWFVRAADADADEETDAAERLDELTSADPGSDAADDEHSDVDGSDEEVDDSGLADDDDSDSDDDEATDRRSTTTMTRLRRRRRTKTPTTTRPPTSSATTTTTRGRRRSRR